MEEVQLPPLRYCPECHTPLQRSSKTSQRTVIDLLFERNGIRKSVVRYRGLKAYCDTCRKYHNPYGIGRHSAQVYGRGFRIWATYYRIALRLPYRAISCAIKEQFYEDIPHGTIIKFTKYMAQYYSACEILMQEKLFNSPFIHSDETEISIGHSKWYVWVFTDGIHALFRLRSNREGSTAKDFFNGYTGVVISDFYAGYDAVNCKQQKCWVHLIRDLNEDLQQSPFDIDFIGFITGVKNLIIPIFKKVEKHGLKRFHLREFDSAISLFYKDFIDQKTYTSELALRYQKRFSRYRESLFNFVKIDGIPWNNNTAERAIRHFAKQRDISKNFFESSAQDYLLLLTLFRHVSFKKNHSCIFYCLAS